MARVLMEKNCAYKPTISIEMHCDQSGVLCYYVHSTLTYGSPKVRWGKAAAPDGQDLLMRQNASPIFLNSDFYYGHSLVLL